MSKVGTISLLALVVLSIARVIFPIDPPFSRPIESYKIYPAIIHFLVTSRFSLGFLSINFFTIITVIAILGTLLLLIHYILGYLKFTRDIKSIRKTNIPNKQAEKIMEEICGITLEEAKLTIVTSHGVDSPCIMGISTPIIFLPDIPLKDQDLQLILLHEWTHFKNKDSLIMFISQILRCIFWWNPFIHLLSKEIHPILELRCDQKVTKHFSKAEIIMYLNALILMIEKPPNHLKNTNFQKTSWAYTSYFAYGKTNNVKQRFELLTTKKNKKSNTIFLTVFMILNFLSFFVIIQPSYNAPTIGGDASYSAENSYILSLPDGTFRLYVDGQYLTNLSPEYIKIYQEDGFLIYKT